MTILNSILQTINLKSYLFQLVIHIFPQKKTMKKIHLLIYYFYCIVYKTIEKNLKKYTDPKKIIKKDHKNYLK